MGKGAALLGLILIIVGLLPILNTMFLSAYIDLSMILSYFNQGIYSIDLAGYLFTEVMLALVGIGVVLLLIGALK